MIFHPMYEEEDITNYPYLWWKITPEFRAFIAEDLDSTQPAAKFDSFDWQRIKKFNVRKLLINIDNTTTRPFVTDIQIKYRYFAEKDSHFIFRCEDPRAQPSFGLQMFPKITLHMEKDELKDFLQQMASGVGMRNPPLINTDTQIVYSDFYHRLVKNMTGRFQSYMYSPGGPFVLKRLCTSGMDLTECHRSILYHLMSIERLIENTDYYDEESKKCLASFRQKIKDKAIGAEVKSEEDGQTDVVDS